MFVDTVCKGSKLSRAFVLYLITYEMYSCYFRVHRYSVPPIQDLHELKNLRDAHIFRLTSK